MLCVEVLFAKLYSKSNHSIITYYSRYPRRKLIETHKAQSTQPCALLLYES
jgi:hypothetical protein